MPVLVMREVIERPEAIAAGTARLVGTNRTDMIAGTARLLDQRDEYGAMQGAENPFGDGHAGERVVRTLLESSS